MISDIFIDVQRISLLQDFSPPRMTHDRRAALIGFLLALPMGILVLAIVLDMEFIETILKSMLTNDGDRPTAFGFAYMAVSGLLLPIALGVSLWPMRKNKDGKRSVYVLNLVVAAIIVALMIPTWGGIAKDIYRCDILGIPNCD